MRIEKENMGRAIEIERVTLIDDANEVKVTMDVYSNFDWYENAGIIRGDIMSIAYGANLKNVVLIYSSFNGGVANTRDKVKKCTEMINTYYEESNMTFEQSPCFFIIGVDFKDSDKICGYFVEHGYATIDHLVDFENNYALCKTTKKTLKAMAMYYSICNMRNGFTFGAKCKIERDEK